MARFLLLYHGGDMPQTEEDSMKAREAWGLWLGQLGDAVVDAGNPVAPTAKHVTPQGSVGDGPVECMPSGYTIVEATGLDAAAEMARGCPVLQSGASISVFETFEAM